MNRFLYIDDNKSKNLYLDMNNVKYIRNDTEKNIFHIRFCDDSYIEWPVSYSKFCAQLQAHLTGKPAGNRDD